MGKFCGHMCTYIIPMRLYCFVPFWTVLPFGDKLLLKMKEP